MQYRCGIGTLRRVRTERGKGQYSALVADIFDISGQTPAMEAESRPEVDDVVRAELETRSGQTGSAVQRKVGHPVTDMSVTSADRAVPASTERPVIAALDRVVPSRRAGDAV